MKHGVCAPIVVICDVSYHDPSTEALTRTLRALLTRDSGVRLVVHAWSNREAFDLRATSEAFLGTAVGDLARAAATTVARYTPDAESAVPGDVEHGITILRVRGFAAERQRAGEAWWRRSGSWCIVA
jgi:hypothetical protein